MYRRYSGADRRRFNRLDLDITVFYRIHEPLIVRIMIGDKEVEAAMLNLSEGGIAFLTNYDIPKWTMIFMKFTLSKMNKQGDVSLYGPMEIMGEVRSNASLERGEYRLGICFTRIDERDKGEISNFVKMSMER